MSKYQKSSKMSKYQDVKTCQKVETSICQIRARGCRAAYFGPWVRWGRGFGWRALSVCLLACSRWVAACWLFLIQSKERRGGRATHPGDPPREPGDPPRDPTLILSLGPKFYIFSVLSPRICFCFVNPYFLAGIAAFVEILLLAVSKHVLKRS